MTNLDSILKSRDITLPTKVHLVKAMVFSSSHVWMWELDHKEGCSVQFSCSVVSDSLWPHEPQHTRPPCPSPTPGVYSNPCPLSWDAIQPSHPLSSPSPPAPNPSQQQGLFKWVSSSHQVAKVLEFQHQHQSFQWTPRTDLLWDGLVGSSCSPRDSQESSPTPQFESINRSADVEAETLILWPPDAKSWLIWKDPDAGKDWGREEKG